MGEREQRQVAFVDRPAVRSAAWFVAGFLGMVVLSRLALPKTVPFGVLLFGLVIGSINALLAVGIVLIHRSNRIINFAQAEVGVFGGILFENLMRGWHLPWLLALVGGTIAAGGLGALIEIVIMRRFANSPRLIVTVATIGVGQVAVVLTWLMASAFGAIAASGTLSTPFSGFDIQVSGVVFSGDALLLLALVPVIVGSIELLLKRTALGIAVRASAESAERAALMGVPVRMVSTLTWVVASALAGLATILHAPVVGMLSGSTTQGPGFLLRALTAAVLARMENLRVAVAAALFIGVIDQAMYFAYGGSTVSNAVFVAIIIVALVSMKPSTVRTKDAASTWVATDEVRPIPRPLRRLREVVVGRTVILAGLAAAVALLALVLTPSDANLVSIIVIYAIVAVSLVILTGWAGQISLGQYGVAGLAAGVTARLSADAGWDFLLALLGGAAVGAVASILLGLVALRLKGFYFAVTSLGFAVAVQTYFLNPRFFSLFIPENRPQRPVLFGRFDLENETTFFVFVVVLLAVLCAGVYRLRHSRTGRAIVAVRDNERSAATYAVSPVRAKLLAFGLSGAIAGVAGGLLAVHQHSVEASGFSPNESLRVFSMVVIGGAASLTGAVLGAVYVRGASFFLDSNWALLASGAGLLGVLMVLPGGLAQLVFRARDAGLRWVADRHGIDVPSLRREGGPGEAALDDAARSVTEHSEEESEPEPSPIPVGVTR